MKYGSGISFRRLRPFVKPRVLALLLMVATATAVLAGATAVDIAYVVVAGSLSTTGATLLNQYYERDIDAVMDRTKDRPLPHGVLSPRAVLFAGLLLIGAAGALAYAKRPGFAAFVIAGAAVYVLVYTVLLKRRTWMNIVIGGTAGSCAVLAGWTAVRPLTLFPVLLATYLFLWTPTHFWSFAIANREDYERAEIPMLPAVKGERRTVQFITVNSVSTVLFTLIMYEILQLGHLYLLLAVVLGAALFAIHLPLIRSPSSKPDAYALFKTSNLYIAGLFIALLIDHFL